MVKIWAIKLLWKNWTTKMQLKIDDVNQIYYWVDEEDGSELSPRFDYEEDAIQWYDRICDQVVSIISIKDWKA